MHFMLIHGSWHGAWCWFKISARLAEAGHTVNAIDLPGHGRNPAFPALVGLSTMVRYGLGQLPADRKTTLVVHSRNGIVASAMAEMAPERLAGIIYVAAYMLPSGRRVADYLPDRASLMPGNITVNRRGLWDSLNLATCRETLYADCAQQDIALARSLLVREPIRPALTRLKLTEQRYGSVPRSYIRLTEDRAVSPALQDRLIRESPPQQVVSLDSSHSAYFSRPDELTEAIMALASP